MKRNVLLTDFFKKVENPKATKIPKVTVVSRVPETIRLMAWNAGGFLVRYGGPSLVVLRQFTESN